MANPGLTDLRSGIMMNSKVILKIAALAIFALAVGQLQAVTITVPNGDFELLYKPGTAITGTFAGLGQWTQGVGPDCPIDNGGFAFEDGSTGNVADIPGWLGYDIPGWISNGGTYGRDQSTGNLQGSIANQHNSTPGGTNCFLANGGGWGNPAGGLIVSAEYLGNVNDGIYTLSMMANGGASPPVLELLAGGTILTPASWVNLPLINGLWQEYSRTYNSASLAGALGQPLTIVLGVGRGATGSQSRFDDVSLTYYVPEPATISLLLLGGFAVLRRNRRAPYINKSK